MPSNTAIGNRMPLRNPDGALTNAEKRIAKGLLAQKWRNQDIQALINIGRRATINNARITEVKKNDAIEPASAETIQTFRAKKQAYDPKTGLNTFDDERLVRAREAMRVAVQIFNSPTLNFKTEIFSVLASIAWTYLLHEFYFRKSINIVQNGDRTLLLSKMIRREDCPISTGMKNNLKALKKIRDEVEHRLLGQSDSMWFSLFQACCLNFDKTICKLFGNQLSLQGELSFALQFSKLGLDQITTIENYDIPTNIQTLDARLNKNITEEDRVDPEYQFKVFYSLDSASKGKSHLQFIHPGTDEAAQIQNVLLKHKISDELYPHKAKGVAKYVSQKSKKKFTIHNHTQAWRKYKIRPRLNARSPENTNRKYCIYHSAHQDYTYSDAWIEFLVTVVSTEGGLVEIQGTKL